MRNLLKTCRDIIAEVWSYVKKILIPRGSSAGFWIIIVLWIVSSLLEPLFCYTFVINDEKKSLEVNGILFVVIWVLFCVLCLYSLLIVFHHAFIRGTRTLIAINGLMGIIILPYWLLTELLLPPRMRMDPPSMPSIMMTLLLHLYLSRVFVMYVWFAILVTRISSRPAQAAGIKILLNLVLYLFGGHLFGGLWYFTAVRRRMECWCEACSNHHGCYYASRGFHVIRGDNKFLNSICLTNDTNNSELGIVEEAFETGIMEVKEFTLKWLYCFRWGLQNLSNFGQSLKVSTRYWQNIFVILVALYGMVTFTFFIGNLLNLVEQKRRQEEKIRQKQEEMEQWFPFKKLSEELQNSIKEYEQYKWQQTEGVNVENLLNNLPIDLQKSVKRDICLQMLRKTEKFQRWSEASLIHICDCLKPVVYAERTRIVNEGDPIIEMYFVLQGYLWTYFSLSSTNNIPQDSNLLTCGDFWGEELVSWAQNELSLSNIPRSNRTIQARTKVEAFALMAGDLKNIFIKHNQRAQVIQSYFRRRRMRALRRNAQTSTQEQAPATELSGLEIVVVQE